MVFDINNKVALVTGGASGIGLRYVKELLRNGARGVTLADVSEEFAKTALAEIQQEFGPNKAIFVKTDVTDIKEFQNAFDQTIATFKNLDILINNAGILNDAVWEKEIAINVNGVVHGLLLGVENYIPKYKSGAEGVVVNISSIAGVCKFAVIPVYTATKFAVHGLTISWGDDYHYNSTKVKVVGICPGVTDTPLISEMSGRNLGPRFQKYLEESLEGLVTQPPEACAKGVMNVIKNAPTGTMWVVEGGEPPYEYKMPERETLK